MAMLIATTFAWFTDSVTSANNKIQAGTLKIDLSLLDEETPDKWVSIKENPQPLFDYDKWEPGYTVARVLKVENKGTLALKWMAKFVSDVQLTKLANVIDVYVCEGVTTYPTRELNGYTRVGTVAEFVNTIQTTTTGILLPKAENAEKAEATLGIALKMQESAGNEYQGLNLGGAFDIQILATQLTHELDSFNNQYDVLADYDGEISSFASLKVALEKGGTYEVVADFTTKEQTTVPEGTTVVLDLKGHTITSDFHKNNGPAIKNKGTLTIIGGTITSSADNGGSAIENNATLTVNDSTLNGAPNANGSWPSYTVNNTGVMTINDSKITSVHGAVCSYGNGAVATLNDVNVDMSGIPGFTSHGLYTYSDGAIIVNSGIFVNHATDQVSTGGSVINGAVTTNGGTFTGRVENYYGTPVIKGGTFSVKPNARFIPEGYVTLTNDDGTYTVVEGKAVTSAAALQTALDNAISGEVINLGADITGDVKVTQKTNVDVIINGQGRKFTGVMTVFGDGNQSGAETFTVKNVNFVAANGADSCIVSPDRAVNNKYSYAHNVTVENCTFTDSDGVVDCAAIRHEDGGDKNWTVKNCTVDSTMHSLFQTNNVIGKLYVENCTVNSKNGLNLNSCTNVVIVDCNINVKGYAVRFGVGNGGNPAEAKNFVIKNSTLKSACDDGDAVIMFRTSAVNAVLNLEKTTLTGTNEISGATAATTINRK